MLVQIKVLHNFKSISSDRLMLIIIIFRNLAPPLLFDLILNIIFHKKQMFKRDSLVWKLNKPQDEENRLYKYQMFGYIIVLIILIITFIEASLFINFHHILYYLFYCYIPGAIASIVIIIGYLIANAITKKLIK